MTSTCGISGRGSFPCAYLYLHHAVYTSQFMPRTGTDLSHVVPEGCTRLAFMGQFVERSPAMWCSRLRLPCAHRCRLYISLPGGKKVIEAYPAEYDRRHFLERMKKYSGIDGAVTKQDLPKINPLKISDMKRKLIPKINSVLPYYIIYEGKEQNIVHKNSL